MAKTVFEVLRDKITVEVQAAEEHLCLSLIHI